MRYLSLFFMLLTLTIANSASAHCQIPCGVYDDDARFESMLEHAKTIEKAMNAINKLSAKSSAEIHTISRWTVSKEEHAQKIQTIAAEYFLTQRVKQPKADATEGAQADYAKHTTLLHQIMVAAMKCKQTTDVANVALVRKLTEAYKAHYVKSHSH